MNKEIKAKWVAALRSDKYKRGMGQLKDGDRYCCLGVLCDSNNLDLTDWHGMPTDLVLREINLDYDIAHRLAYNNDGCADEADRIPGYRKNGTSFNSIANWIEKNL